MSCCRVFGKGNSFMSVSMSWFLGGGVLSAEHWSGHCHWYSTYTLFCYRHHCHCFLLQFFWLVLPWPLGVLMWFGSFLMIWLVVWLLMEFGRHRLGLLGILDFQVGTGIPLVLQLYILSWSEILRWFLYCHVLFQIFPWPDLRSQSLLERPLPLWFFVTAFVKFLF